MMDFVVCFVFLRFHLQVPVCFVVIWDEVERGDACQAVYMHAWVLPAWIQFSRTV